MERIVEYHLIREFESVMMIGSNAAAFVLSIYFLSSEASFCNKDECLNSVGKDDIDTPYEIDWNLNELDQRDPKLISIIREKYLIPPSESSDYNFTVPLDQLNYKGQCGQPTQIDRFIFKNSLNAKNSEDKYFFIEAGAFDGEVISNSLHYEIRRGWNGLLIEPNPDYFSILKQKQRKAWLLNRCISTKKTPQIVEFDASGLFGGIIGSKDRLPGNDFDPTVYRRRIRVQCFPLYSIIMALGNPAIHYLSLDIEGAELPVLRTIPFEDVDIKLMDIESNHMGEIFDGSKVELVRTLADRGYRFDRDICHDSIFIKYGFKVNKK
ncbi:protein Star [Lepeophtheirus salmonis]|uniref:protein Star n=1 Tax=Lepeophtheirus salmonis TaxID=72036 RepID=UPI001AE953A2|nr:uncharacterized protein LOC121129628 [Lepeophtheirus salmonis]